MLDPIADKEKLFEGFEYLMPFRVENILMVSSLYDSFILREDGRLNELLISESLALDMPHVPSITHVCRGAEALQLLRSQRQFSLVLANLEIVDMTAAELAAQIRDAGLNVPVVVLAYDYREIKSFIARYPASGIERIFLWQGNARILIAIVKYIEDKLNVQHDTAIMGVPVVLLVEDNIRYYSAFLPVIYTELITQSRRLLREGFNVAHKLLRMRARPKILLCSDYQEAAEQAIRYQEYLFGVISDVEFPCGGELRSKAGFELAHMIHRVVPDVPIVLQSSRAQFESRAQIDGFSFLRKGSQTLLNDLRLLLTERFALGDFVFRLPDGTEVGRASDLNSLEALLQEVPVESIAYHSERNHFSHWLSARTEFALAQKLRPRKHSGQTSYEDTRQDLIESIAGYRREQSQVLIGDFGASTFKAATEDYFLRIGSGSLGGKARGLAFVRQLLRQSGVVNQYPGIRIAVPPTVVLTTDVFDQFLSENNLFDFALRSVDDLEIQQRFLAASLPSSVRDTLLQYLGEVRYPLAVRSSSLLEDSQQPFTGVYETFMVANQNPDLGRRLEHLTEAIKRVFASTFSRRAKAYIRATPYRLEEEKMAVVLQQVVGAAHGSRFYPDFSGVVRSRNFYPVPPMVVNDGIAAVALGLGRTVVNGERCLMFCAQYPRHPIQFSSVADILANSQSEFWALELEDPAGTHNLLDNLREVRFGLDVAESDGTLRMVGSTYCADTQAVYDGLSRPGVRVVSFAPILKHGLFPLASILNLLTRVVEDGLGRPVEIEFAVRLPRISGECAEFGFLQTRPLAPSPGGAELIESVDPDRLLCQSSKVLGNGRIEDLHHVLVADFHYIERSRSRDVAREVAQLNAQLSENGIPYLLIGVGRWGSSDPWLGIPVAWEEVSGARVIVEAGFRDFRVTPSQGSHFFQNIASFHVGYFTINPEVTEGFIDWKWLAAQPALNKQNYVRHLHFDEPLVVIMNGSTSHGVIFKPGGAAQ